MGLVSWLRDGAWGGDGLQAAYRDATDDFWYRAIGSALGTAAGVPVDADRALEADGVLECVQVIAETLATLPLIVYRRTADGGKERAPDHPVYELLHRAPNGWQTAFEFVEQMQAHLLIRRNSYAEILRDGNGTPVALEPLHPATVTVERLDTGRLRYSVRQPNGAPPRRLLQEEVFHLRGLSLDGITGLDLIQKKRESIAVALAAEKFGARYFKLGAATSGVFETPKGLSDKALKHLRESLDKMHAGFENAWRPVILEDGLTFKQTGANAKDAQLVELRQVQRKIIASFFRVPPHKIGILDDATFSNIEQQALEFVSDTLMGPVRRWEAKINRELLGPESSPDGEEYFAEFLLEGLLRAETAARYQAYNLGIQAGFLTRNEARVAENRNPLPGLDTPLEPLNMQPAGTPRLPGGAPSAPGSPNAPPGAAAALFAGRPGARVLLLDAAQRIAAAEQRELGAHLPHAAADPARFATWAARWWAGHEEYVTRVVAPFTVAAGEDGAVPRLGAASIAAEIVEAGRVRLGEIAGAIAAGTSPATPADALAGWAEARAAEILNVIVAGLAPMRIEPTGGA